MFPGLIILIGLAVLAFGKRLSVLGAAVGALLGVGLMRLFTIELDSWTALLLPGGLAIAGFFLAALTKTVVNIIIMVLGALAGAAIVLGMLDIFNVTFGIWDWLFAAAGAGLGLFMVRRFADWALIILAGLVGAILITRGLTVWFPSLQGALGTLLVIVLAGGGIAYQGGIIDKRRAAAQAKAAEQAQATPPPQPVQQAQPAPQVSPTQQAAPIQQTQPAPPPQPAPQVLPTPPTQPLSGGDS
jgi:hypothetical protein